MFRKGCVIENVTIALFLSTSNNSNIVTKKAIKMGVKIRYKDKKDNRQSIYLDIYKDKKRKYEFLDGYYRYAKPKTDEEKRFNKVVDEEVAKIAAERNLALLNHKLSFVKVGKADNDFLNHFKVEAEARYAKRGAKSNTYCCYKHLLKFTDGSLLLKELTTEFAEDFKQYLVGKLSQNCARTYFLRFKMVVSIVHKKGFIQHDPTFGVAPIKHVNTTSEFLELEEIEALKSAECKDELLKRMFLFGCYTALRVSDLKAIKWGNVKNGVLRFNPVKTPQKLQTVYLNQNALVCMGDKRGDNEHVFPWRFEGDGNRYDILKDWARRAKITKNLTWHIARHTCASHMLLKTCNMRAVQMALGHSRMVTTERYAHLLDSTLVDAFNSLD